MITKTEWQAVNRQLMDDDRRRLGEPPTAEEMLAYTRGELSPEKEAEVRARLVCYPELVRTLTEPFPADGAEPGDPDYVADEEYARHWAAMQKRMTGRNEEGRVVQFWRALGAIAAVIAVGLGVLLWQTTGKLAQPRAVWQEQVLFPDSRRGPVGEPVNLVAEGDPVLLVMQSGARLLDGLSVEIIRLDSSRVIWRSAPLHPTDGGAVAILVPRRFLAPGDYQIALRATAAGREETVSTYSLRVPRR